MFTSTALREHCDRHFVDTEHLQSLQRVGEGLIVHVDYLRIEATLKPSILDAIAGDGATQIDLFWSLNGQTRTKEFKLERVLNAKDDAIEYQTNRKIQVYV